MPAESTPPPASVWYRDKDSLQIGGVSRYTIRYSSPPATPQVAQLPESADISSHAASRTSSSQGAGGVADGGSASSVDSTIYFRVKNEERAPIRAIHLLNGPFTLYCHVVPCNYDHKQEFLASSPVGSGALKQQSSAASLRPSKQTIQDAQEVVFKNEIKPGQSFKVALKLNKNSLKETSEDGTCVYEWSVDVVSQIVITSYTYIHYDVMVGSDLKEMKSLDSGINLAPLDKPAQAHRAKSTNSQLEVIKETADEIWTRPPRNPEKPVHLVIVTHGIFANTTADMLYLKDSIEDRSDQNVIVRGFNGNSGHTERGIKRLGVAVANYIVELIDKIQVRKEEDYTLNKISFIGHSLGGCVQLYAIKYILVTKGSNYFQRNGLEPDHLICMASPLLGVLHEMSFIISWFLDIGALGKTGRDLTLSKKIPTLKDIKMSNHEDSSTEEHKHLHETFKPLLEVLPNDPLQGFLRTFNHLTLYANAVNDGIVPLRTSSLLYLDWEALGEVGGIKEKERKGEDKPEQTVDESEKNPDEETANGYGRDNDNDNDESSDHASIKTVRSTADDAIGEVPEDDSPSLKQKDKTAEIKSTSSSSSSWSFDLFSKSGKSKRKKKHQRFQLISAKGTDPEEMRRRREAENNEDGDGDDKTDPREYEADEDEEEVDDEYAESEIPDFNIPPKASAVESALNTLICPVPSTTFITKPNSRHNVIFHDKYYSFKNVPHEKPVQSTRSIFGSFLFKYHDNKVNKQVKIARKYHDGLTWRKVLVHLPPDAHNNIIVRRRFANGYGWGVVDHVVQLFQDSKPKM